MVAHRLGVHRDGGHPSLLRPLGLPATAYQPDQRIISATPSADGLRVRLVIDSLVLVHIHELRLPGIRDRAGQPLLHDVAYDTLNEIPRR